MDGSAGCYKDARDKIQGGAVLLLSETDHRETREATLPKEVSAQQEGIRALRLVPADLDGRSLDGERSALCPRECPHLSIEFQCAADDLQRFRIISCLDRNIAA